MGEFVDWTDDPTEIVQEALRDFVGDGEGADVLVLAAHDAEVEARLRADYGLRSVQDVRREAKVEALREAAESPDFPTPNDKWRLRRLADRIEEEGN